jgi:hypothetical protein
MGRTSNSAKALAGVYVLSAGLGAWLGIEGLSAGYWETTLPLTPAARVGYALTHELPANSAAAWTQLASDLGTLKQSWPALDRPLLELVVAARGLDNSGRARRETVQHQCESLPLLRCDESALDLLMQQSRPQRHGQPQGPDQAQQGSQP